MRIFVAGKLVQRSWQELLLSWICFHFGPVFAAEGSAVARKRLNDGNKRQSVEIQVTHVGPDLQFATADVTKSTAEGLGSASDGPSAATSAEVK
jgi:hypothetical protein